MTNKRKVCFISSNIEYSGGTERVAIAIMNELASQGYDVSVISIFKKTGKGCFFNISPKIKIIYLDRSYGSFRRNYIKNVFDLRRILKKNQFSSVVCIESTLALLMIPSAWFSNIRTIVWEHFNYNVTLDNNFRIIARIVASIFSSYVVTLTDKDKKTWLSKFFCFAKIVCINNPITFKNCMDIPSLDNKTALAVGRLTYQKGFDNLIDIWVGFLKLNPDWKLVIVGDGEDKKLLEDKVFRNGISSSVIFKGELKDLHDVYRSASVYVMTSRYEGLPMVLLEAINYSLPIVSYNCETGPSEVVINNENGFLVRNQDSDEFISKLNMLSKLSHSDYLMFCDNSRLMKEKFDINSIVTQWNKVLK